MAPGNRPQRVSVDTYAALMRHSLAVYREPDQEFASHGTVDHGRGEYARGSVHVYTAVSFFSQLKRSIHGIHHHLSERHLDRYFYSQRKSNDSEHTQGVIQQATGNRLRYEMPTETHEA